MYIRSPAAYMYRGVRFARVPLADRASYGRYQTFIVCRAVLACRLVTQLAIGGASAVGKTAKRPVAVIGLALMAATPSMARSAYAVGRGQI